MDSYNFCGVVNILTALSPEERRLLADQLQEQLNQFTQNNGHGGVKDVKVCPHCGCNDIGHWGRSHKLPRYRCQSCKRTFNLLTNTSLSRLRHRERWLTFLGTMYEKRSIRKSAKACGVHSTTAHRWLHRFRDCAPLEKARMISTIILTNSSESLQTGVFDEIPEALGSWSDMLPLLLSSLM